VIACNTASSVGLPAIRQRIEGLPIIGVIEPGAEAACAASRSGYIAVVATEGTVRGGAYQEAILRLRRDARITAQPAQLFVALAEEGLCEGSIADSVARHYLGSLFHTRRLDDGRAAAYDVASLPGSLSSSKTSSHADLPARPDTLVLGCTHFPMLAGAIRAAVGPDVNIVDSAATTAKSVRETLERAALTRKAGEGTTRFLATDAVERFARIGSRFLERPIAPEEVELVDL
jgi:glutamate racemase